MQTLPLKQVPNQSLKTIIAGQQTGINLYQLSDNNLYIDISLNNNPIVSGVLVRNNVKIIRNLYLGFNGDFVISDTQGSDDPLYTGLGSRWQLIYMSAIEANDD
jgi:hypothetical protein